MSDSQSQTIAALSSAPGRAGIAVVRVSGPAAGEVSQAITGRRLQPRLAQHVSFHDPGTQDVIDRGLAIWMPGPDNFTGENIVEFQCHGSIAVTRTLLNVLIKQPGCRLAEPGEFARRAFINGRLDLAEVEGLADLIDAETDAQRKQALGQAGGVLSTLYEHWRAQLISASALTEAAIDFSDEGDVARDAIGKAHEIIMQVLPEIQAHLDDGHRGEIVRDGFRVVLLGPPNVGKSSLLNALARRDVAIVSPEAGTTRDIVEVRLDLNGYPVIVTDTAGLRDEAGTVEQEGIRRAQDAADNAHLVLWLTDGGDKYAKPAKTAVRIQTKADLSTSRQPPPDDIQLAVSAKTGAGLDRLIALIGDHAAQSLEPRGDTPVLTQVRHRQAVTQCAQNLEVFLAGSPDEAELRAEDLRGAIVALGRITGRVDVEDVLDKVFGQFCIGK